MLYLLSTGFTGLSFFSSIYLRVAIAFILAFFMALFFGRPFIEFLKHKKFGENIRDVGPETHHSKKGTPTMGGVLIIVTILLTTFIAGNLKNSYIILLIIVTILFALIGFIDDYKKFTESKNGLSGRWKLIGQLLIGLIIWIFIIKFKPSGQTSLDFSINFPMNPGVHIYIGKMLTLVFIVLIIMGASNAVNLTDGLDGLAIVPVAINALVFGVIAYLTGHVIYSEYLKLTYTLDIAEITIFISAICGASLGFLWYNSYPAEIFMGDTGSLALGGILGTLAILLKQELLLPIAGGVFVLEAASVILQVGIFKYTKKTSGVGKRIFRMAPIHHHFELAGKHETKVTMRFWIFAILFGIIALVIIRLRGI
ncbi:MAG: phospho-N-acetylmuramoyl-pentapeptide-transferase [Fusobacteriaceae bacterium]